MRVRISTICNTRSVGHFLHCNGGESLSRKRFLHTLPSAAHKEVLCLLNLSGKECVFFQLFDPCLCSPQ
ncbi:hypothetical protein GOP47_0008316 [Adiantum capillus-veneris]|uniref:Uncharacterized protein n=1 Tax=Adiantum capillus-veneris TaxID=13818 RepID=A0A9D4UYK6_ADICA|nr:hypothetical protein GOP47_0008316 [Adiantum capillus-veneris]